MTFSARFLLSYSLILIWSLVSLSEISTATAPGAPVDDFEPEVSGGSVDRMAVRPDGKVLITGDFTSVDGYASNGIALLTREGEVVSSFKPPLSRVQYQRCALIAYPDGRVLVGGGFSATGNRSLLVRLNADGTLDSSFHPMINGSVESVSLQRDGKILVCGSTFQRLNPDGSNDQSFVPIFRQGRPTAAVELADGKILIGGQMDTYDGNVFRVGLIRLQPNGAVDLSFDVGLSHWLSVDQLIEQPDGKIVAVGLYVGGENPKRQAMKRIMPDGAIDSSFNVSFPEDSVTHASLQSDGKMVLACSFPPIGGKRPNALIRLQSNGSLDPSFVNPTGVAHSLAITPDGGIIVAGYLGWDDEPERALVTKVAHDSQPSSLQIPDHTTVKWLTGGSFPEHRQVVFDLLTPSQANWVRLGRGQRVAEGWILGGLSLPPQGIVRLQATSSSGQISSTAIEMYRNFGSVLPDLSLEDPAGQPLSSGSGVIDFGDVFTGQSRILKLSVRNRGQGALADVVPVLSGAGASLFQIISKPDLPVLPGEAGVVEIKFSPISNGMGQATLTLASNDVMSPHSISLIGTGGSVLNPTVYAAGDTIASNWNFNTAGLLFGQLRLGFTPEPGTKLLVLENLGSTAISGRFPDLADGATISVPRGGVIYTFVAGYGGGDGNDLVLTLLGPGVLDASYAAAPSHQATVIALPEGRNGTVVGGAFVSMNGQAINRLAKISEHGLLMEDFNPNIEGGTGIETLIRLESGDLLVGGYFSTVKGIPISNLVRLKPDGFPDPAFRARVDGPVSAAVIQPDGKIVIAGGFGTVNSISRSYLARLNPDGSLDTSFTAIAANGIRTLALQSDGKILVGGSFVASGLPDRFLRLLPDGTGDASFTVTIPFFGGGESVDSILVQPTGHIVFGGRFNGVNSIGIKNLARITPSGELDTTFRPEPDNQVYALQQQADGNLLIGGAFFQVGGVGRKHLARITPQGVLDPSFVPDISGGPVMNLSLQSNGSILAGGGFDRVNGVARRGLVRIFNDPVSSSLDVVGTSSVRWSRGGSLPEEQSTEFQIREAGVSQWKPLGLAQRTIDGWELGGLQLPASGLIRAKSSILAGDASYPQLLEIAGFGETRSMMQVSISGNSILERSSAQTDFGTIPSSLTSVADFKILNLGTARLDDIVATIEGAAASDFSVTVIPPVSISAGETAIVKVKFSPAATGVRTAALRLASNDPDGDLLIQLVGRCDNQYRPNFYSARDLPTSVATLDLGEIGFSGLGLEFAPTLGTVLTAIQVTGMDPISGKFAGVPDGSLVTSSFGGVDYVFSVNYRGGDGNDLAFHLIGPGSPDGEFSATADASVHTIAVQSDGTAYVSGEFTQIGGQAHHKIARLKPGGLVDSSFTISAAYRAEGMAVTRSGQVLVDSTLTDSDGFQQRSLARLNRDGTLDRSFRPDIRGTVYRVMELRDGRILIGGTFNYVNEVVCQGVAMLHADGRVDRSFTARLEDGIPTVYALAEQNDGKLILGGPFLRVNGIQRRYVVRLNPNGTTDTTFNPTLVSSNFGVSSLAVQPDGKILMGGYFTMVAGIPRKGIVRLNSNGTIDLNFIGDADNSVTCILVQSDGRIIISGLFSKVQNANRSGIARLMANGDVDPTFNVKVVPLAGSTNPYIYSMGMLPDGEVLAGGYFTNIEGASSSNLASLKNDPAQSELHSETSGFIWKRSGSVLALEWASLEVSMDGGSSWSILGDGVRIDEGWKWPVLSIPDQGFVRAVGKPIFSSRSGGFASELLLVGRGMTTLESWRNTKFGSPLNDGQGADLADADQDGLKNLLEYGFGLDPLTDSSGKLPEWEFVNGGYEVAFQKPVGVEGIGYDAEWSETLDAGDWHPAENIGDGEWEAFRVPVGAQPKLFFRLKVANP